jgi:hypothetical protein
MVKIMDTETHDKMMHNVIEKIKTDDEVIKIGQSMKRKKRLYLAGIIYNWVKEERIFTWNRVSREEAMYFFDRFAEVFSEEVYREVKYRYEATLYGVDVNEKKGIYYVHLYDGNYNFKQTLSRAVVKYDEETKVVKVCYVETCRWTTYYKQFVPLVFKGVTKVVNQLTEAGFEVKDIKYDKKHTKIVEEAIKRKYLMVSFF